VVFAQRIVWENARFPGLSGSSDAPLTGDFGTVIDEAEPQPLGFWPPFRVPPFSDHSRERVLPT